MLLLLLLLLLLKRTCLSVNLVQPCGLLSVSAQRHGGLLHVGRRTFSVTLSFFIFTHAIFRMYDRSGQHRFIVGNTVLARIVTEIPYECWTVPPATAHTSLSPWLTRVVPRNTRNSFGTTLVDWDSVILVSFGLLPCLGPYLFCGFDCNNSAGGFGWLVATVCFVVLFFYSFLAGFCAVPVGWLVGWLVS